MSHPDIDADAQAQLAAAFGQHAVASTPDPTPEESASPDDVATTPEPRLGPKAKLRRRVRTSLTPVAEPVLERLTEIVSGRIRQRLRAENDELAASVAVLNAQVGALQHAVAGSNAFVAGVATHRMGELEINAELMKSELAAFRASLEDVGQAIAPAAGERAAIRRPGDGKLEIVMAFKADGRLLEGGVPQVDAVALQQAAEG